MGAPFRPLPLEVFTEEQRPHIARLNAALVDMSRLEAALRVSSSGRQAEMTATSVSGVALTRRLAIERRLARGSIGGDSGVITSVIGNLPEFSTTIGDLIDSGLASERVTIGPATSVITSIPTFSNTTGDIQDPNDWQINASGHLVPTLHNASDIGTSSL